MASLLALRASAHGNNARNVHKSAIAPRPRSTPPGAGWIAATLRRGCRADGRTVARRLREGAPPCMLSASPSCKGWQPWHPSPLPLKQRMRKRGTPGKGHCLASLSRCQVGVSGGASPSPAAIASGGEAALVAAVSIARGATPTKCRGRHGPSLRCRRSSHITYTSSDSAHL